MTDEWLRETSHSTAHFTALKSLGATWVMHVPILTRGRPVGVMTFIRTAQGPAYELRDLARAEELCDRVAVAIMPVTAPRASPT